jgi:hypothetical protein
MPTIGNNEPNVVASTGTTMPQRAQRGCLYRHDNAPDHPHITTHPKHFHNGAEEAVEASHIPDVAEDALRYFLDFVRLQVGQLGV